MPTAASEPLTSSDLKRYEETGILFPIPVLSAAERQRFRAEVDQYEALLGTPVKPPMFGQCHLHFQWAYELSTHARVLDAVEQIIGPDILVHSTTLFSKHPGGQFVSWHQDGHYWDLSEPRLVSAWIALSESTTENGCLRVQPGTHFSRLDHDEIHDQDNMLGTGSTVKATWDEGHAVDVVLRPGEMSFHHANLVHGSNANRSTGNRVGFAIRYVAPEVSQRRRHHEVVLARGQDRYRHYDVLPAPPMRSTREGIATHLAFSQRTAQLDQEP